jgi:hypothetical protein
MLASAMPSRDKNASKRKENQACLGYLEREQFIQIDAKHNNEE